VANRRFRAYTGRMSAPSLLSLAAVLALCAAPAFAAPATPGTKTPHSSGDWGKDEASLRAEAAKIFRTLVDRAHEGVLVGGTTIQYALEPVLEIDLNNMVIGGSPAAAFSAGRGLNSVGRTIGGKDHSAHDLVYTTNALYTMADRPEAGVFLAHELGHLARGHAKKIDDAKKELVDRLFTEWSDENPESAALDADASVKAFFKAKSAKLEQELIKVQSPLEKEADEYGRELAVKAGIKADASVSAFERAQDWMWALKLDMADAAHGGTVADRAAQNAKWAADRRAALERAETAKRRALGASQGMSVP